MVAADFLQQPQVRQWLDGVEPAWTLLTFESLRALRQEPSAGQSAIRIANDLSTDEVAGSAVAAPLLHSRAWRASMRVVHSSCGQPNSPLLVATTHLPPAARDRFHAAGARHDIAAGYLDDPLGPARTRSG
jgi:hypothetical protein